MNEPLVSIIIPCYNAADFVGEAIESALGQTYGNVEVIVIDDGSTDESVNVLRSFGDRICWETGPNRGSCAVRNRGLEMAKGDLIQWLDADDLIKAEKIEFQVGFMSNHPTRIPYCESVVVDNDGMVTDHYRPHFENPFFQACLDRIQTAAPLHRKRQLVRLGGFDESLPCAQERDLHIRLACDGSEFHHQAGSYVEVRRREGSLSSDSVRVLDQHKRIITRACEILASRDAVTDDRCRALAGVLAKDARAYLARGMKAQAADYFAAAREIHPEGGLETAYSRPVRALRKCIGPQLTEQIVQWRRRGSSITG